MLKNASGRYCYRYTPGDEWVLWNEFTPDETLCHAYIAAKEGPLPVGADTRSWRVYIGGKWVGGTLTVGLTV